jgi:hypothetical protein
VYLPFFGNEIKNWFSKSDKTSVSDELIIIRFRQVEASGFQPVFLCPFTGKKIIWWNEASLRGFSIPCRVILLSCPAGRPKERQGQPTDLQG